MGAYPSIAELLPHRGPAVLLDAVLEDQADSLRARVRIRPDHPYFEAGPGVPAWVGIEYMAQAIAAGAGLSAREKGNQAGKTGFLLGCRSLKLTVDSFQVGDRLTIEARRTWGENQLGSFACTVQRDGQVLVEGALTVYQGPIPKEMR